MARNEVLYGHMEMCHEVHEAKIKRINHMSPSKTWESIWSQAKCLDALSKLYVYNIRIVQQFSVQ